MATPLTSGQILVASGAQTANTQPSGTILGLLALTDAEHTASKGAINGYAPLDGSALVPAVNLPTYPAQGFPLGASGGGYVADVPVETVVSIPSGVGSVTLNNLIPANKLFISIGWIVETAIPGVGFMNVGDESIGDKYGAGCSVSALAQGNQNDSPVNPFMPFSNGATAQNVVLTFDVPTTGSTGSVKFSMQCMYIKAPTF